MALIRCPECKKKYSSLAAACPSCGAPVAVAISADKQDQKNKQIGFFVIAGVVAFLVFTSGGDKDAQKPGSSGTAVLAAQPGDSLAEPVSNRADLKPAPVTPASDELSKYISQLDREIASIPGVKAASYVDSIGAINTGLLLIGAWALVYEQGEQLALDKDAQRKRQQFRSALLKKQTELLPAMRDAYGPLMRRQLWEANGSARTIGAGYKTVEFVSVAFADNANIKKIHDQIHDMLIMLRFTRAQYKWFAQAEEYSYYTLESPKDSDLVRWETRGSFRTLK